MEILDFFISVGDISFKYGRYEEYNRKHDQSIQKWREVKWLAVDVVRVLEAELCSFLPSDTGFAT